MKNMKKTLATLMALLLMGTLPLNAVAGDWYIDQGDITVNAGSSGQTVRQGDREDPDSAPVITQKDPQTSTSYSVTIKAEKDQDANVTIKDVNIDTSGTGKAAVSTEGQGDVTVELDGDNTIKSDTGHAGLEKNNEGELTITDKNNDGSLDATGGTSGAGIGGGNGSDGSNITIEGGTITATGGSSTGNTDRNGGTGIGGGNGGNGSNITITGGDVTATGGNGSAGIGGGSGGDGSDITISGGKVTASSFSNGAGIGGGYSGDVPANGGTGITGGNGTDITITGGVVEAKGGFNGAGIGSAYKGKTSDVTITGGDVTANGGGYAAGIGGTSYGESGNVTISGGTVTVKGNSFDIGKGNATNDNYVTVVIGEDAEIDAKNGKIGNRVNLTVNKSKDGKYTATSQTEGAEVVKILYGGSETAPTEQGTYTVTCDITKGGKTFTVPIGKYVVSKASTSGDSGKTGDGSDKTGGDSSKQQGSDHSKDVCNGCGKSNWNYVALQGSQHIRECANCPASADNTITENCNFVNGECVCGNTKSGEQSSTDKSSSDKSSSSTGTSKSGKHYHHFGEWTPNGNGTHLATCTSGSKKSCKNGTNIGCETFEAALNGAAFTLCPVCGELENGTRLELVEDATATSEKLPKGELVLRENDEIMSAGFEYAGKLTQPTKPVTVTLPAEVVNGYALSILNADGTETALETTADGENVSFTIDFGGAKVVLIHMVAAAQ